MALSFQAAMLFAQTTQTIVIKADEKIHAIRPDFWGTNLLYWIDDDASLSDGGLRQGIKDAGLRLLRYPGGTVADNFHWRSGTLDNINMFPFQSGAAETDFDEFIALCRQSRAEPMCVLNTESWAIKNDVKGGAHEAAEWLRYCKRQHYQVKYWEIGNETYWHPVLSASEYADLVNIYADSLKNVDPEIILGVNGHWDIDFVGTKERIRPSSLSEVLALRRNINSRADHKQYETFTKKETTLPITSGAQKWWPTVAAKCGDKIDMIIVHWYFAPAQLDLVAEKLNQLQRLWKNAHPAKDYVFNMSEFNVTTKTPQSFMHLTEMMGLLLNTGFDLSAIWPMRMEYKKPVLFNYKDHQPSIFNQVFRRLSNQLTGHLVPVSSTGPLHAYAAHSEGQTSVVLSGRKVKEALSATLQLEGTSSGRRKCSVWRISGDEFDYKMKEELLPVVGGRVTFLVHPSEVVIAVFNKSTG